MIDPRSRWFAPEQFGPALKTWASVWEDEDLYSSSSARSTGRSSLTEESFAVQAKNNFGGNENQSVAKETWEHGNDAGTKSLSSTATTNTDTHIYHYAMSDCSCPSLQSSGSGVAESTTVQEIKKLQKKSELNYKKSKRMSNAEYVLKNLDMSSNFLPVRRAQTLGHNMASTYGYNSYAFTEMLHTTSICYPWVRTGIKYEHTYDGLKQEITDFYNYIRPRSYERYIRTELFNIIRSLLKATFPDIKVEMYGSFKTDIFLPTSDIDIVVYGNWEHLPLNAFRTTLLRSGLCTPGSLVILERALVPIIKFRSIQYNLKIDITFNTINAPKSAAYIQSLLATNPAIKILVMTLKQFLLQRDANEVYHGGISSYALLLMVAAFIKSIPYELSAGKNHIGKLLVLFLEFYGVRYDYSKYAISLRSETGFIEKSKLVKLCGESGSTTSPLCIEDPLQETNDVGRSSFGVITIKNYFEAAYISLMQALMPGSTCLIRHSSSILGRIILITPEVTEYRKSMKTFFKRTYILKSQNIQSSNFIKKFIPQTQTIKNFKTNRCPSPIGVYKNDCPVANKNPRQKQCPASNQKPVAPIPLPSVQCIDLQTTDQPHNEEKKKC